MRGLTGKRVLITGGASGIGAATAQRFIEEEARVFVLDRDAAACEAITRELTGLVVGIARADRLGHDDMVGHREMRKAQRFGSFGQGPCSLGRCQRTADRNGQANIHDLIPSNGDSYSD